MAKGGDTATGDGCRRMDTLTGKYIVNELVQGKQNANVEVTLSQGNAAGSSGTTNKASAPQVSTIFVGTASVEGDMLPGSHFGI